jgi:hypothetical protein
MPRRQRLVAMTVPEVLTAAMQALAHPAKA